MHKVKVQKSLRIDAEVDAILSKQAGKYGPAVNRLLRQALELDSGNSELSQGQIEQVRAIVRDEIAQLRQSG